MHVSADLKVYILRSLDPVYVRLNYVIELCVMRRKMPSSCLLRDWYFRYNDNEFIERLKGKQLINIGYVLHVTYILIYRSNTSPLVTSFGYLKKIGFHTQWIQIFGKGLGVDKGELVDTTLTLCATLLGNNFWKENIYEI